MCKQELDIIIPIKNNFAGKDFSVYYTVKSILAQKCVTPNIFLVDDNSTDKTLDELFKMFGSLSNISIVENPQTGTATARNFGASLGKSDLILFVDDDTILNGAYTIMDTINNMKHYAFGCGAIRRWTPMQWPDYLLTEDTYRSWLNILDKISFLPKGVDRETGYMDVTHVTFIGNYGMVQRDVLKETDGFAELYKGWGLEDTHFMYTLCLKGFDYCLFKDFDISVYHLNHNTHRSRDFSSNLKLFQNYQKKVGIYFSESAFFNEFDGTHPVLRKVK